MVSHHSEVEKMEPLECLVMSLGLVDMAWWVSMEERHCEEELDKGELVEARMVEQVETVGWTEAPVNWM